MFSALEKREDRKGNIENEIRKWNKRVATKPEGEQRERERETGEVRETNIQTYRV